MCEACANLARTNEPKTLDEALDRAPYLADLAGIPRS